VSHIALIPHSATFAFFYKALQVGIRAKLEIEVAKARPHACHAIIKLPF
jgi:hypothetical protein